jgi:hypothetical protein
LVRNFHPLKKIIRDINQKFNRFLWNGKDSDSTKAKVAWSAICFPKKERGRGLKILEVWKRTTILSHILNLFACACSIWVAWIKIYMLKGKSFWNVNIPQDCSLCWRSLLKLRSVARNLIFFFFKLEMVRIFICSLTIGILVVC